MNDLAGDGQQRQPEAPSPRTPRSANCRAAGGPSAASSAGECRDEGGVEGALAEQPAEQVGQLAARRRRHRPSARRRACAAISMSRAKPRTRLAMVQPPTVRTPLSMGRGSTPERRRRKWGGPPPAPSAIYAPADQCASGSGRICTLNTRGRSPLPVSLWNGARVPVVVQTPRALPPRVRIVDPPIDILGEEPRRIGHVQLVQLAVHQHRSATRCRWSRRSARRWPRPSVLKRSTQT